MSASWDFGSMMARDASWLMRCMQLCCICLKLSNSHICYSCRGMGKTLQVGLTESQSMKSLMSFLDDLSGLDLTQYVVTEILSGFGSETYIVLGQNPYAGAGPIVGKVLIVCPVTLITVRVDVDSVLAARFSFVSRGRTGKMSFISGRSAIVANDCFAD